MIWPTDGHTGKYNPNDIDSVRETAQIASWVSKYDADGINTEDIREGGDDEEGREGER